jgi:hypothetical protein
MRNLTERVKQLEATFSPENRTDIVFKENYGIDIHRKDGKVKVYRPTPTGIKVHSSKDDVIYMQGPFGSGKSVIAMNDLVHRARRVAPWKGSMRASKAVVVRNTSGELKLTTLPMWLEWYEDVGCSTKNEKPVLTYRHQFNFYDERDGESGIILLEIIFLPLDTERVLGKIDSLNVTFAYINEMRHLPKALLDRLRGRTGRYPSIDDCKQLGISHPAVTLADSNPPKHGHWIEKDFEVNRYPGWVMVKQPPGLIKNEKGEWMDNPAHDTYEYVRPGYYTRLATGASEEFIKVYCLGEYGLAQDGKPVFSNYNDDLHSTPTIAIAKDAQLFLGWDFGLTPSCIVGQLFPNGRLTIIKEFVSSDMGIKAFAENMVLPWLRANDLERVYKSIGDPAGNIRAQTDEFTCINILDNLHIKTEGASTNSIVRRIENVRFYLNKLIEGKPALVISREHCPALREGFMSGYHYRKIRTAEGLDYRYTDEPDKNEYSHPHDALQYLLDGVVADLNFDGSRDYGAFSSIVRGL